jgi:hypothetical protein
MDVNQFNYKIVVGDSVDVTLVAKGKNLVTRTK